MAEGIQATIGSTSNVERINRTVAVIGRQKESLKKNRARQDEDPKYRRKADEIEANLAGKFEALAKLRDDINGVLEAE